MYHKVKKRHFQEHMPIDEQLFEEVGKDLGLSMSRTRQWYYWYKDQAEIPVERYIAAWNDVYKKSQE